MPSNIQLELQLNELRTEVEKLKSASAASVGEEIRILREALDRTFREAGLSIEWSHAKRQSTPVVASEVAERMYQREEPTLIRSAASYLEDIRQIQRDIQELK